MVYLSLKPPQTNPKHHANQTTTGHAQKLEILMYADRSLYALQRIIRYSADPVARSVALQELLDLIGVTHTGPTQAQIDAMVAELAANGTVNGVDPKLAAGAMMAANQTATPVVNQTWVPTLSVPGGLTNVTGGVDNTL